MKQPNHPDSSKKTPLQAKKDYESPQLTHYGSFQKLTRGGGGVQKDGGTGPKTKATGVA